MDGRSIPPKEVFRPIVMKLIYEQKCFLVAGALIAATVGACQIFLPTIPQAVQTEKSSYERPEIVTPQEKRRQLIVENMTVDQAKEAMRDSNDEISLCMAGKAKAELRLPEAEKELAVVSEKLRQAKTRNIFNSAEWYNPFALYEANQAKEKEIANLSSEESSLKGEVNALKETVKAADARCKELQEKLSQMQKNIAELNPEIDMNMIAEDLDSESIGFIKADKIDRFVGSMDDGWAENDAAPIPPDEIQFMIPVSNYIITSDFGYRIHPIYGTQKFHSGTDLGVDYGETVVASAYGRVVYAGWYSGFGNTVILSHAEGVYTLYGHNEEVLVQTGDIVDMGMPIALAGSTGNSTGPHCHWSMWIGDELVDPMEHASFEIAD